jgi:CheY-like chemotaxis protein
MDNGHADVLLVEDDANDIAVALRAFQRSALGGRIKVLRDGVELLNYLDAAAGRQGELKLILLDLKMPRLDGRRALRALRTRDETRHVPVVVVSSSDRPNDVRDCYDLGANSYVVKQLNAWSPGQYLVDTVRYWLEMNEVAR